jgi:hypothetical protein
VFAAAAWTATRRASTIDKVEFADIASLSKKFSHREKCFIAVSPDLEAGCIELVDADAMKAMPAGIERRRGR